MSSEPPGSASRSTAPDPESASTAADFVAQMRAVRHWSGLTMRQISARARAAGDVLPHSTLATALSRTSLPREELVAAFIRACVDDPETVRRWVLVRKRIAVASAGGPEPGDPAEAEESAIDRPELGATTWANAAEPMANQTRAPSGEVDAASAGGRAMFLPPAYHTGRLLAGVLVLLLAIVATGLLVRTLRGGGAGTGRTIGDPSAGVAAVPGGMPEPGAYRIMPLATYDRSYCIAAGREPSGSRPGDVAVLSPCASAVPASSELRVVAATTFQIYWADPAGGGGCLQVDRAEPAEPATAPVHLVAPHDYCSQPDQRFMFEAVATKYGTGYRLHPVTAPGLCIGTLTGGTAKGTAIAQAACTGKDTEIFIFTAV